MPDGPVLPYNWVPWGSIKVSFVLTARIALHAVLFSPSNMTETSEDPPAGVNGSFECSLILCSTENSCNHLMFVIFHGLLCHELELCLF